MDGWPEPALLAIQLRTLLVEVAFRHPGDEVADGSMHADVRDALAMPLGQLLWRGEVGPEQLPQLPGRLLTDDNDIRVPLDSFVEKRF